MKQRRKNCDECEQEVSNAPGSLKQRIWEFQLSEYREIYLNGEINDDIIEKVVAQIQNCNAIDDAGEQEMKSLALDPDAFVLKRPPIKLFINSSGGAIDAAFSAISAIEVSRTPVWTIALGKAMSAGFLLLIAGHVRYAQKYSELLYHQGTSGYVGRMQDIAEYNDYLQRVTEKVQQYVMDATDITQEDLDENLLRKFDWYMTPMEALEYGCIDGIWGYDLPEYTEEPDDCDGTCRRGECTCEEE